MSTAPPPDASRGAIPDPDRQRRSDGSSNARDLFRPGDRRCTFEGCGEDAAVLMSDDGHIALCPAHAGEYAVLGARFKEAPTQDNWRTFQRAWVAAMGGGEKAAARMTGYSARKGRAGHG